MTTGAGSRCWSTPRTRPPRTPLHGLGGRARTAGTVRIAVVHRVGTLAVGDLAVVAAVNCRAPGRGVCGVSGAIDRFQGQVPVWKHQHFTDGGDEWVGVT